MEIYCGKCGGNTWIIEASYDTVLGASIFSTRLICKKCGAVYYLHTYERRCRILD